MVSSASLKAYDAVLAAAERHIIPLWSHLDLTFRCNLRCLHCYCRDLKGGEWQGRQELGTQEWMRLIDELAELKALYLVLSGGEPLLREDFFAIAQHAKDKHFCITMYSNGTCIGEGEAGRIASLAPQAVEMSIYGCDAETHEKVTRVAGSFDRLLDAVRLLKRKGVRVVLKTVFLQANVHQAEDLERFCTGVGADEFRYTIEISPRNDRSREVQRHQLEEKQMHAFLAMQHRRQEEARVRVDDPFGKPVCAAGVLSLYVSPFGDVYPCPQLFRSLGNVRERSLIELWHAPSQVRQELGTLKTYADFLECAECPHVGGCKKCMGLAHLETGDVRSCYPMLKTLSRLECSLSSIGGI